MNAKILNGEQKEDFEKETKENRWTEALPSTCRGVLPLPVLTDLSSFESFCFYVYQLDAFNPNVIQPGKYDILIISYESKTAHIRVFDSYSINVS